MIKWEQFKLYWQKPQELDQFDQIRQEREVEVWKQAEDRIIQNNVHDGEDMQTLDE